MHYDRNVKLTLFLLLPILGFLLGWSLSQKSSQQAQNGGTVSVKVESIDGVGAELTKLLPFELKRSTKPKDVDLSVFWETWNLAESNFLHQEKLSTKDQIYGAAKGLVQSLKDPYTAFMTPEETAKFEESISGEFEGIGAELAIKNEKLTIVAPLKGSPAELAGLKAGDVIVGINEEPTFAMTVTDAVTKIRGPRGEKVVLTIQREGKRDPIDITIVRDNILLQDLEWEMKDDVAVITISQFGTDVVKEFQTAVEQILLQNPRGIVLDLRNNGGGLLDACIKISSAFFDKQIIVKTRGRNFGSSGDIYSERGGSLTEIPLVVIVNKGSASASEIFAGAVQDHKRGLLLGEKTFGKGSVQNVIPLSDGSSLKVTIAEWLTPEGHSINEKGIDPDEVVELTQEDFDNGEDPIMERALDLVGTDEMRMILSRSPEEKMAETQEEPESEEEESVSVPSAIEDADNPEAVSE